MYYRRKFLLGFIQAAGGTLKKTKLEKLLFLYMKDFKSDIYCFFPYRFGCFSLISYQDKEILTNKGYLKQNDDFVLAEGVNLLPLLKPGDKRNIRTLLDKYRSFTTHQLVAKTYIDYPTYTINSEIVEMILSDKEFSEIKKKCILDDHPQIATIGYEGITIDQYLFKLITNNSKAVVDVRKNPQSMKWNFNKKRLSGYLKRVGIEYFHIPELGIPSEYRQNLTTPAHYTSLFTRYREEILPSKANEVELIMNLYRKYKRIALTCFESTPDRCHRLEITKAIKTMNGSILVKHM